MQAYIGVLAIGQPLAGLDEEIDDLRRADAQQRRQLGARMDQGIEIEPGGGEVDPEIAAALDQIAAFDDAALDEERCRIGFSAAGRGRIAEFGQCIHRLAPSGARVLMATPAFH